MTREIKFRAWDKKRNEMLIPDGLTNPVNSLNPDVFVHMQFTGLKDVHGKEIYEGDIVDFAGIKWMVGYYGMNACFTLFSLSPRENANYIASAGVPIRHFNWLDNGSAGYKRDIQKSFPVEVIGNIYENPDLLTPSGEDKQDSIPNSCPTDGSCEACE
jgi:uncharacterized phage protein (TIGR01671 family)